MHSKHEMNINAYDIANRLKQLQPLPKPYIIAIDGFPGSGKSTFATRLRELLGDATVIHIDDFFVPNIISDENKSNFDRKRLTEQVLKPARQHKNITYQKMQEKNGTLSEFFEIGLPAFLIIEGVSSHHPDIKEYIDFKIWIDCVDSISRLRMIDRDKAEGNNYGDELWNHWVKTYAEYKRLHKPELSSDAIVQIN